MVKNKDFSKTITISIAILVFIIIVILANIFVGNMHKRRDLAEEYCINEGGKFWVDYGDYICIKKDIRYIIICDLYKGCYMYLAT